jgi:hypothetical protein
MANSSPPLMDRITGIARQMPVYFQNFHSGLHFLGVHQRDTPGKTANASICMPMEGRVRGSGSASASASPRNTCEIQYRLYPRSDIFNRQSNTVRSVRSWLPHQELDWHAHCPGASFTGKHFSQLRRREGAHFTVLIDHDRNFGVRGCGQADANCPMAKIGHC